MLAYKHSWPDKLSRLTLNKIKRREEWERKRKKRRTKEKHFILFFLSSFFSFFPFSRTNHTPRTRRVYWSTTFFLRTMDSALSKYPVLSLEFMHTADALSLVERDISEFILSNARATRLPSNEEGLIAFLASSSLRSR